MCDPDLMDPLRPFAAEIAVLRGLLGLAGPDGARGRHLTLGPCMRLLFDRHVEERMAGGMDPPDLADLLDEMERRGAAGPKPGELPAAPRLERWCAGLSSGGCPRLYGLVSGHPLLRTGARVATSPYLQARPAEGWARTWSRHYRLGRQDPLFLEELLRDGAVGPGTTPIDMRGGRA